MTLFTSTRTLAVLMLLSVATALQAPTTAGVRRNAVCLAAQANDNDSDDPATMVTSSRRSMLQTALATVTTSTLVLFPTASHAGIDVSGLPIQGGGGGISNPNLQQQLKAYDGSAVSRVQEIKSMKTTTTTTTNGGYVSSSKGPPPPPPGVATWALRATDPTLQSLRFGTWSRYNGQVVAPEGPQARDLLLAFDFPADWLALDRASGCIQYVDQRNGAKLYLLRATLPAAAAAEGEEAPTLATINKKWIASAIFDPQGSFVQSGQTVEDYSATGKPQLLSEEACRDCPIHRRFTLKYATVTGNGLRVERRGLVDAYQFGNDVYMLLASVTAVQFEKGGPERDTMEDIVNSFSLRRY